MIKSILAAVLLTAAASAVAADHYVQPHVNRNGTYVEGHMQTNPNNTRMDNYSTQGNINPYTGQAGTVNPYAHQPSERLQDSTTFDPYNHKRY